MAPTTAATTSDPVTASTTTLGATASTIVPPPSGPIVIAESAEEIGVQIGGSPLPFTLNPFLVGDWWRLSTRLDPLLFGGAWEPGAGGEPVADLVESLPDPTNGTAQRSADGSVTLSYRIRSDASWADGMPVSSDDFELTLRILQEDTLQIRDDWKAWHEGVGGFEVVSDTEFRVTMAEPLTRYRHLFPVVVPAHVVDVDTFAEEWTNTLWPSAGSLRLVSFERMAAPLAGVMVLEPNPTAPGTRGVPDGLVINFYQRDERGDSLAVEAFLTGEADLLGPAAAGSGPHVLDRLIGDAAVASSPPSIWEALFLQSGPKRLEVNPNSQLDNSLARHAVARALLGDTSGVPGQRITSLVEYFVPGAENPAGGWSSERTPKNRFGAIPLVYETTDGELTMEIARGVKPFLESAGFEVDLRFDHDASAAFARFGDGAFEAFAVRQVRLPGSVALLEYFDALSSSRAGFPDLWPDPSLAAAFRTALDGFAGELDPDGRLQLLIEAEEILVEAMFLVPLVTRSGERWVYHADGVVGPGDYETAEGFLANFTEWHRP